MDISKLDKNFDLTFTAPEDIEWFSALQQPFSIHGVFYAEEEGVFRRLPKAVAEATNNNVAYLSKNTAGGRVRFLTDSPYIAVHLEEPFAPPFSHMTPLGKYGISLFTNRQFAGSVMPSYDQIVTGDPDRGGSGKITFGGIKNPFVAGNGTYLAEIFLPLYNHVCSVHIGLKQGCQLLAPTPYTHETPVVFYGSSITQGGCAAKPGDDYIGRLCRQLDTEILNLGFSGGARAEKAISQYIAEQPASVYVLDYDHNAPTVEHLQKTHYPLYETVRKRNPDTPIILMTMPTIESHENRDWYRGRGEVILETFEKAKANGDNNIYFVDCHGCFGALVDGECGVVDASHPDSLGFLRMAERVYPVLNQLLNGKR